MSHTAFRRLADQYGIRFRPVRLEPYVRELIYSLLRDTTLSKREIARRAGVSHDTVRRLASEAKSKPYKCPKCGAYLKTQLQSEQCFACEIRSMKDR